MASLSTSEDGSKRVITKIDGKRRTIYLGKLRRQLAETVRSYVSKLEAATQNGAAIDADVIRWLGRISDELHAKLAKVGLAKPREKAILGPFLKNYIESRHDVKPLTTEHLQRVQRDLLDHFGEGKLLRDITPADADDFRLFLLGKPLAENTVRRRCGRAKQFFHAAVRRQLIASNPFADVKSAVQPNESRFYFVTREEAQAVLDACPDAQWRLLFALSRFGGLRCPSEHLALRLDGINWEKSRMTVWSPKTEHHEGGESRVVPIFPELRPYLEEVWEEAEPGTEFVITRYRDCNANLRTQLKRIIRKAGLKPWPKLFQNLRATRATELADQCPGHVAATWLGHCERIADRHYRNVTEEHFAQAVATPAEGARHPTRATSADGGNAEHKKRQTPAFTEKNEGLQQCTSAQAPRQGLEPWTKRLTAACSTN